VGKGVLSFSNIEDEDDPVPLSWLTTGATPLVFTASIASPSLVNGGRLEDDARTVSAPSGTLIGPGGAAVVGDVVGEVIGRP
jgi:hypothetical protein